MKVGKGMACRAEWKEFGKAGLGRKAGKHGTGTKGKNRHKRNGRTGYGRTGQDGKSGNAWASRPDWEFQLCIPRQGRMEGTVKQAKLEFQCIPMQDKVEI